MRTATKQRSHSVISDERRRKVRFALVLPTQAEQIESGSHIVVGHTENLSSSGFTLVLTDQDRDLLSTGDQIHFEIELAQGDEWNPTVQLRGTGRVVRTMQSDRGPLIAVKIRRKHVLNSQFSILQG